MKIRLTVVISTQDKKVIERMIKSINEVRSGEFQRTIEFDHKGNRICKCKATVEILEKGNK